MNEQNTGARTRQPSELIDALLELLAAPREPDFYAHYAELVQALCRTESAMVVDAAGLDAGARAEPVAQALRLGQAGSAEDLEALAAQFTAARWQASAAQGYSHDTYRKNDGLGAVLLLVRLLDVAPRALLLSLPERDRAHLKEALVRALLVKDLRPTAPPLSAVTTLAEQPAASALLDMLGLATEVLQAPRFGAATLTLVNGAVRTLGLRQAALCWRVAGHAQVLAISHIDKFESTSRLVSALEAAAAEVLSTDQVISWSQQQGAASAQELDGAPAPAGPPGHQALLDSLEGMHHVTSLPMRDGSGQTQAVLIAVGDSQPLPQEVVNQALLMLEMVYPRLADSRWRDANPLQRLRQSTLQRLELFVGPGRPWLKFGALMVSVLLLVLLFVKVPYRVEASAQLITDSTRVITAQNDGRLLEVLVDVGDTVRQGQALARLDTTDLQQQQAEVLSDIQRYASEEDKARATGALAEMQIARARRVQAEAKLKRVSYFLQQSRSEAPFDGVVVEGERRNLLGSSVKRGDKLFRIAQVRDLYVVLQVPEHAIRELRGDAQAELLLLSQPDKPIRLQVSSFVPMAQVKGEEGNQFVLKAQIVDPGAPWWRPGMTGLARIDAGSRNITWVLFHRAIDKLRLWLWW
ncbi:MAG: efflux RND transporter periplasmic adaptor subunit [Betaproteobacteria bacterium]